MKNVNQSLLSLGEAKLGIQAATSIGYDTQALGLMAVAVALIGVNVALARGLGPIWWLPLGGLGGSLLISVAAISQPEIDTGQDVSLALRMDVNGEQTDRLVLTSIAQAINDNTRSLQDKRGLVALSTLFIGLSFALVGVAQLSPSFWETIESLAR
jgi:hypothetical protein